MSATALTSPVITITCRGVARVIQVFGFYVIFHGHYSPGGGFQGGTLLAAAVILLRIGEGHDGSQRDLPSRASLLLGAIGVLLFALVGVASVLTGGAFLEYDWLPLPGVDSVYRHYWGILIVELGVGLAVMTILVSIFDRLMERPSHD